MLNSSQETLSALLLSCAQGEETIEAFRKILSEQYDFSPSHFFSLITPASTITSRELHQFLQKHSIQVSTDEILMLIKQYSNLQDGRLTYEDFLQIFLPSADLPLRQRARERALIKTFEPSTLGKFLKVLEEEAKLQSRLEEFKEKLYLGKDFSVYAAFELIANGKSWVDELDLGRFLGKFGKSLSDEEFEAFLRRTDLEGDGAVNYNEFLDFIVPFNVPQGKATEEEKTQKSVEGLEESQGVVEKTPERRKKGNEDDKEQRVEGKEKKNEEKRGENLEGNEKKSEEKAKKKESIAEDIFELLAAVKLEETNRQSLASFGEVSVEIVKGVLTKFKFPAEVKENMTQGSGENQVEAVLQVLGPLDSDYQLNVVEKSSRPFKLISEGLVKAALESYVRVQDLTNKVFQKFNTQHSGKDQESFNSDFILQSLGELSQNLLERDLNLLLNRLDLTD